MAALTNLARPRSSTDNTNQSVSRQTTPTTG
jgi:hypothetical protein